MSFEKSKRSLASLKGHYGIVYKSFISLLALKPQPTEEAVQKMYGKLQERYDKLFKSLDDCVALLDSLEDEKSETSDTSAVTDVDKERSVIMDYYERVFSEQNEIESQYVAFKCSCSQKSTSTVPAAGPSQVLVTPAVRLTALSPPSWNGAKADFCTWKRKFVHIMKEARVTDELTQLCYVQNGTILPKEYQTLIADCLSLKEVWTRLTERVPKDTIQSEVISQFRNLQPLPARRSPKLLRDFANELSLFCRRMADLGLQKQNYSCIIMRDVYDRLDQTTTLRYRSKLELKRELFALTISTISPQSPIDNAETDEDLESISAFLRSEATTLELSMGDGSQSSVKQNPTKYNNVMRLDETSLPPVVEKFVRFDESSLSRPPLSVNPYRNDRSALTETATCPLGCSVLHRFVDCEVYLKMNVEKRKDFVKNASRCFICLGTNHTARNCSRKRDSRKCHICSKTNHHWTLCHDSAAGGKVLNPTAKLTEQTESSDAKQFCSADMGPINSNINNSKKRSSSVKYAPMVLAEAKTADGTWCRIKCFLDTGSNASLIRLNFAQRNGLPSNGPCNVEFSIAGGGTHQEKAEEFELQIRPLGSNEAYPIVATGIKKPCSIVPCIPDEIFDKHEHLQEMKRSIYTHGGEVDLLLGLDYAPLILPEKLIRSPSCPDDAPSVACTRLGCYIYGGFGEKFEGTKKEILFIQQVNEEEMQEMRKFFYGEVLGVQPTSTCMCSDNMIAESAFIKHVQATTKIDESGRVSVRMPWKPGFPEKLPNNYHKAKDQLLRRQKKLVEDGKFEEYDAEIDNLLQRGVVKVLNSKEAETASEDPAWYLNHRMLERKNRLVFDSASRFAGICLNDAFEKGPVYTNSLFRCLLKWRRDYVAVAGDIVKMFNQISMVEEDQRYHRFLWRKGEALPILVLQWLRVLFGDKPSPDLAGFALRFLANVSGTEKSRGAEILCEETYVDDITFCEPNSAEAQISTVEVDTILDKGSFQVKSWNSNIAEVDLNKEERIVDVLGLSWDKDKDLIGMNPKDIRVQDNKFTKRVCMSIVPKLWDPFGYTLPVSISYRIDLQRIWEEGLDWDDPLPFEMADAWKLHLEEMRLLEDIQIIRCLKPADATGPPQLHAFSDGGSRAYGTCVFLVWPITSGFEIVFVEAKAFVAPLKFKTIPRLELLAALAMGRLTKEIIESLGYELEFKRFWIDSEVVLYWLSSLSNRFKPFVATRIQEFQDTHCNFLDEIRYVPSENNPADCLTKPITVEQLKAWLEGEQCSFLKSSDDGLGKLETVLKNFDVSSRKDSLEIKAPSLSKWTKKRKFQTGVKNSAVNTVEKNVPLPMVCTVGEGLSGVKSFGYEVADYYTSRKLIVSAVAFLKKSFQCHRFIVRPDICTPPYLVKAELTLFYISQEELRIDFDKTKVRFLKLQPFKDQDGLIRAQGRLRDIDIPADLKHHTPARLSSYCQIVCSAFPQEVAPSRISSDFSEYNESRVYDWRGVV